VAGGGGESLAGEKVRVAGGGGEVGCGWGESVVGGEGVVWLVEGVRVLWLAEGVTRLVCRIVLTFIIQFSMLILAHTLHRLGMLIVT